MPLIIHMLFQTKNPKLYLAHAYLIQHLQKITVKMLIKFILNENTKDSLSTKHYL